MRLNMKSAVLASLVMTTSLTTAFAQDAQSTGYAGEPLGLTLRSFEGTSPDHSVTCLDRTQGGGFDCIVWTGGEATLAVAQAVSSGASLLGIHSIGTEFANAAVAIVADSREVAVRKFDRIAASLDAEISELGDAARVSVRRPGSDDAAFVAPSEAAAVLPTDSVEESGRLSNAIGEALDDLATFEARPRTLVILAGSANSDRQMRRVADRAEQLNVRTIILRLDGSESDANRLTTFADRAGGSFIDLSAEGAEIPSDFSERLSRAWRLAFHDNTEGDGTDVAAFRFSDGSRTEFEVGTDDASVLNVGGGEMMATGVTGRLSEFVPQIRSATMIEFDRSAIWAALLTFAGLSLAWGLTNMRRRKVVSGSIDVEMPVAETEVAAKFMGAAETAVAETEVHSSAKIKFADSDRVEQLRVGTIRIGREKNANDIVIDAPAVSRRHATITTDAAGRAYIENLTIKANSPSRTPNPVVVNGAAIDGAVELANGDEVQLGDKGGVYFCFVEMSS